MDHLSRLLIMIGVVSLGVLAGCDSGLPDDADVVLVVEGFIDADRTLPHIRLRRTLAPAQPYDENAAAVNDAEISLQLGASNVVFVPDGRRNGLYLPESTAGTVVPAPGDSFALQVAWQGSLISGEGIVPPVIDIRSTRIRIPDEPVSAVLLDSLVLSDSLSLEAQQGFIYPIEVTITWEDRGPSNANHWVRAQLQPYTTFSSSFVELFLRSEEIFEESSAAFSESGIRTWTGVYAVGVEEKEDPVPPHDLRVALIRSGEDYARSAASRHAPERREPFTNLRGGVGIFTAISVDSTRIHVGESLINE